MTASQRPASNSDARKRAEERIACTVNLLGGTCPVRNLCPVHGCTEEWCHCEDDPTRVIPPGSAAS